MRLSTDESRDEGLAVEVITAASAAGMTVFDTARAYGRGPDELGHNERLLARALRRCGAEGSARIVTKGGMTRPGGTWVPDGRAKALRADCEASLAALDGLAIDLYLIHAPDPRTPWQTSLRALARLRDEGLVRAVGVANVNRRQLDEALDLVQLTAVQVALGPFDDGALRGGVVDRCTAAGVAILAHSPLGGPGRVSRLARRETLIELARAHDATPAELALAWTLGLSPGVVALPGARRPETARSAARAAKLDLDPGDRGVLARELGAPRPTRPARRPATGAEVVLVMGIPGAGKSRLTEDYVGRGYLHLNRDERGGSLRGLAEHLDEQLASGADRVILDSTYLTRASRSYVIEATGRHGARPRCLWLDTPLAQAQVNLVERLLDRFGSLPAPDELRGLARREPGLLMPTSQMRALRELEPPSPDEGWAEVRRVPFVRAPRRTKAGVFVAAAALGEPGWQSALTEARPEAPHLIFDWLPDGTVEDLAPSVAGVSAEIPGPVEAARCPHAAGPPRCWCRPPLPGLPLAFARRHGLEPARSILIGSRPAHRTLASALGAQYVAV